MQNRLPFEQKKFRAKKRKKALWLLAFLVLCAALFIYAIVWATSLNIFKINTVSISGNNKVSTADVQTLASRDMAKKFLWIFPDSSWFFVPTGKISRDILNTFSAVDSVSVHRRGLTGLSVTIKEKTPEAWWCDDATCTVLDDTGTAFDIETRPATDTSMVVFESSTTPAVGESPVSGGFPQILIFINALAARGLNPTVANVKTGEIDITIASSSQIWIDPTKDLTQALANLDLILSNPQSPLQKNGVSNVKYIDLRFDGKVFYKDTGTSS